MDFAWALSALKAGLKVTRSHWKTGFLWCKPAARVQPDWCKDPVLKQLAEQQEGGIPASSTISACFKDFNDTWAVITGWVPQQFDLFADDWEEYVEPKNVPLDKTVGQIMRGYKTRLDSLGRPDENCANCEKHGWFEGKFVCRASKLVTQKSSFGDYCSEWEQEKDDGAWDPQ